MKLILLSDSHESRFWKQFVHEFDFSGYDYILHLGDNYSDIYDLDGRTDAEIVAVPGLWRKEYQDPRIENVKYVNLNGVEIIMSHVEALGRPLYSGGFFIHLFGHTHNYKLHMKDGHVLFNPGHLKNGVDRGCDASYGEIVLEENMINCYIKNAEDGKTIKKESYKR